MDIKRMQELAGISQLTEAKLPTAEKEKEMAYNDGVRDAKAGKPKVNASDRYGPYGSDYTAGYHSVK